MFGRKRRITANKTATTTTDGLEAFVPVCTDYLAQIKTDKEIYVVEKFMRNKTVLRNEFLYACKQGKVDIVKHRIDADNRLLNAGHYNPLHIASMRGDLEFVRQLLSYKDCQIDKESFIAGQTALFFAAAYDHVEVVKCLLEHAKTSSVGIKHKGEAIQIAAKNGRLDSLKLLLDSVVPSDEVDYTKCLNSAITGFRSKYNKSAKHTGEVKYLDVDAPTTYMRKSLLVANYVQIIKLLLVSGAKYKHLGEKIQNWLLAIKDKLGISLPVEASKARVATLSTGSASSIESSLSPTSSPTAVTTLFPQYRCSPYTPLSEDPTASDSKVSKGQRSWGLAAALKKIRSKKK